MTEEEFYKSLKGETSSINTHDQVMGSALPVLMRKMYLWMALALAISGVTAWTVASSEALLMTIFSSKLTFFGMIIAQFGLVMYLSARIDKLSLPTATLMFIAYSVLTGVTLSSIFVVFELASIAQVFFITAGTFGAMSVFGYFTKTDLSKFGKILMMGLIGIIIATIVNLFLKNSGMDLIISYIGVLIFTGLTAWDVQTMKKWLSTQYDAGETAQKMALLGALNLYLDFINLFLYLLRIFGDRK